MTEPHSNKIGHKIVSDHLDAVHNAHRAVHDRIVERVHQHAEQRRQQALQQQEARP